MSRATASSRRRRDPAERIFRRYPHLPLPVATRRCRCSRKRIPTVREQLISPLARSAWEGGGGTQGGKRAAGEAEARLEARARGARIGTYALSISSRTFHMFIMLRVSLRDGTLAVRSSPSARRHSLGGIAIGSTSLENARQMFPGASDTHDGRAERHQAVAMLSLPRLHGTSPRSQVSPVIAL